MNEINTTWFTITNWDKTVFDTPDVEEARLSLREGKEVVKTTRRVFASGPSNVYLTVITDIKKIKAL